AGTHESVVFDLAMAAVTKEQDGAHDFFRSGCGRGGFALVLIARDLIPILGAIALFARIGVVLAIASVLLLALVLGRIADQLIFAPALKYSEAGTGIIDRLLVI